MRFVFVGFLIRELNQILPDGDMLQTRDVTMPNDENIHNLLVVSNVSGVKVLA